MASAYYEYMADALAGAFVTSGKIKKLCRILSERGDTYKRWHYDQAKADKSKVYQMMRDKRIRYYAPADYTEGSELERLICAIVDKTAAFERLEDKYVADLRETREAGGGEKKTK